MVLNRENAGKSKPISPFCFSPLFQIAFLFRSCLDCLKYQLGGIGNV